MNVSVKPPCPADVTLRGDNERGINTDTAGGNKEEADEVILLGCRCSQPCHRKCIDEWCRVKGDRVCEICGEVMANLAEPPPRPPPERVRDDGLASDDFTVVMRPAEDGRGAERVIVITQGEVDASGAVTIHRYYASGDDNGSGARHEGDDAYARASACFSELVYLLCFTALFLLFFGTPGAIMAGFYLAWYVCVRATFP